MLTEYRTVSFNFGSEVRFLQFKSYRSTRRYFGLFGEKVDKPIWRSIPDIRLAYSEKWFSPTDFPTVPAPDRLDFIQESDENKVDCISNFIEKYPDIELYVEEIRNFQITPYETHTALKPLHYFILNYKEDLLRVRRFTIRGNDIFLINFPRGDRAAMIKKDGLESKAPWIGISLISEEVENIGDLIESYFYKQ